MEELFRFDRNIFNFYLYLCGKCEVMKKIEVFLFTFLLVFNIQAQELLSPVQPDKDSTLTYTFTVVSEKEQANTTLIAQEISRRLTSKAYDITYARSLDTTFVDAVFHLDTPGILRCGNVRMKFRDAKDASQQAFKLLEKKFYSGKRPSYSTLFKGDDGRYVEYRIPTAVVLPTGRVITFIEARSTHRDQAENDIIARYSDDRGKTWSPQIVVAEKGASSLNNPCVVYVPERDEVLLMYQCFPPNVTEGSAPVGMNGNRVLKAYITKSRDGGKTWTMPVDITAQVKHPEANSVCSGPGVGIRVEQGPDKGRIIMPFNGNGWTRWFNYIVYSDDCGDSWKIAPGESGYGTNESQIVQVDDTTFLFNARSHRYPEANSYKSPAGWNPWNFSQVTRNRAQTPVTMKGDHVVWGNVAVQTNQPDPTCQGSIIRMERKKPTFLLSNPASQLTVLEGRPYSQTPPMRMNGTVKVSYDSGKSWRYSKRIYGNRFTEYQYSVLVDMGNGNVGCIFEAHPEVKFAVFNLKWLTEGADK